MVVVVTGATSIHSLSSSRYSLMIVVGTNEMTEAGGGRGTYHCPTKQMIGDFMSKPLQGELFNKFKAAVVGHNNSLFKGHADLQG